LGSYLPVQNLRLATEEAVAVVTAQVNAPFRACALEGRKTSNGGARCVWYCWEGRSGLFFALPRPTYLNSPTLSVCTPLIPGPGSGVPGTWSSSWGCRTGRLCGQPCCSNRGQRGCGGRNCRVGEGLAQRKREREREREREKEREREHRMLCKAGLRWNRKSMGRCGWG
jgi:hypothetical protein